MAGQRRRQRSAGRANWAGWVVSLTAVQTGPGSLHSPAYRVFAHPIAAADGTIAVELTLSPVAAHGCGQCGVNGCGADPTGEQYTITAIPDREPGDPVTPPARATFTVASPAMLPSALPRVGAGGHGRTLPPWGTGTSLAALTVRWAMYTRCRYGQAPRHGSIDAG